MNRILALISTIMVSAVAIAQQKAGTFSIKPMAGLTIASMHAENYNDFFDNRLGYHAGLEAEYSVGSCAGLSLGAIYTQQGADVDGEYSNESMSLDGSVINSVYVKSHGKMKVNYLQFPLLVNYYIPAVPGLTLKAGVEFSVRTDDRQSTETIASFYNINLSQTIQHDVARTIGIPVNETDVCKQFDLAVPLGLSYEYRGVSLDVRYHFGLSHAANFADMGKMSNRSLSLSLGYRFSL